MGASNTPGFTPTSFSVVSDQTIVGAAASAITFNLPLNLEGDNNYVLKAYILNADVGDRVLTISFNNDTTDANYISQNLQGQAAAVAAARGLDRTLIALPQQSAGLLHGRVCIDACIKKVAGAYPIIMSRGAAFRPAGATPTIDVYDANVIRLNTENVTRFDINTSDGGAYIGIGSRATLYKVV